jgi:hypothetical protein
VQFAEILGCTYVPKFKPGHFPLEPEMKVLEIRIAVSDFTPDEALSDVANIIKNEIGSTGLDVHDVTYTVKPENAVPSFVM